MPGAAGPLWAPPGCTNRASYPPAAHHRRPCSAFRHGRRTYPCPCRGNGHGIGHVYGPGTGNGPCVVTVTESGPSFSSCLTGSHHRRRRCPDFCATSCSCGDCGHHRRRHRHDETFSGPTGHRRPWTCGHLGRFRWESKLQTIKIYFYVAHILAYESMTISESFYSDVECGSGLIVSDSTKFDEYGSGSMSINSPN